MNTDSHLMSLLRGRYAAGILAILPLILQMFGVDFGADQQAQVTTHWTSLVAALGGLFAVFSKVREQMRNKSAGPESGQSGQGILSLVFALFALISLSVAAIGLLGGCGFISNTLYPGQSIDEAKIEMQKDAYTIGQGRISIAMGRLERGMIVQGAKADKIKAAKENLFHEISKRIADVKASTDPLSIVNKYFYDELSKAGPDETLTLLGLKVIGEKILKRIGILSIGEGMDQIYKVVDFNKEQFLIAVDSYERAINDYAKAQGLQ